MLILWFCFFSTNSQKSKLAILMKFIISIVYNPPCCIPPPPLSTRSNLPLTSLNCPRSPKLNLLRNIVPRHVFMIFFILFSAIILSWGFPDLPPSPPATRPDAASREFPRPVLLSLLPDSEIAPSQLPPAPPEGRPDVPVPLSRITR